MTVQYNLDHLLEADNIGLGLASGANEDPPPGSTEAEERAFVYEVYKKWAAYLVWKVEGIPSPPQPGDPDSWEGISILVLKWLTTRGAKEAGRQMMSLFRPAESSTPTSAQVRDALHAAAAAEYASVDAGE